LTHSFTIIDLISLLFFLRYAIVFLEMITIARVNTQRALLV